MGVSKDLFTLSGTGPATPEDLIMLTVKTAGLIAIFSITTLVATNQWPHGWSDGAADRPVTTSATELAHLPAVLRTMPDDEALDCRVEAERTFVPSRKAFVMKKTVVCR